MLLMLLQSLALLPSPLMEQLTLTIKIVVKVNGKRRLVLPRKALEVSLGVRISNRRDGINRMKDKRRAPSVKPLIGSKVLWIDFVEGTNAICWKRANCLVWMPLRLLCLAILRRLRRIKICMIKERLNNVVLSSKVSEVLELGRNGSW